MAPTIRSGRVALTPVELREAADLWKLVRTPPAIEHFPDPRTGPDGLTRWLGEALAAGTYVWTVRRRHVPVGLLTAELRSPSIAVVGYSIDERWIDDSVAGDALGALVDWLFEARSVHRVELRVATGSLALWRVAQQAGFCLEGVARESWRWAGAWHDARDYALLRREWLTRKRPARPTQPVAMHVVPAG